MEKLKTILVCANLKTKQTLAEFLSAYDYDVVLSTQYAFECIETFEQTSVDVVIADTFVYDLELCELLRRLRLSDFGANTLFVITSKAADLSLESKLDLCAPDLFTLIPTDFDSLDKKIRYSLEQKRQTAIETRKYQSDEFKTRTNIRYLVTDLGVKVSNVSFEYIIEAVYIMVCSDNLSKLKITKDIYPVIADKFKVSAASVEKAIRSEINNVWSGGDISLVNEIFGYSINSENFNLSNTCFLRAIADRVLMDLHLDAR